jgi:hypothetical protein
MALFSNLFGDAGGATATGVQQAQNYGTALASALPGYTTAQGNINQYFGQAAQPWQAIVNPTQGGLSAYADITGAAGTAGQNRAQALFQTDPGYQFARDQALQATQRATGTGGYQGSGNVLTALQDRASGLAQQQYGNYVDRLYRLAAMAPQGATGLAGVLTGQGTNLAGLNVGAANLQYNTGIAQANAIAQAQRQAQDIQNASTGAGLNIAMKLLGYGGSGSGGGLGNQLMAGAGQFGQGFYGGLTGQGGTQTMFGFG